MWHSPGSRRVICDRGRNLNCARILCRSVASNCRFKDESKKKPASRELLAGRMEQGFGLGNYLTITSTGSETLRWPNGSTA